MPVTKIFEIVDQLKYLATEGEKMFSSEIIFCLL